MIPSRAQRLSQSLVLWKELKEEATTEMGCYIYLNISKVEKNTRGHVNARLENSPT